MLYTRIFTLIMGSQKNTYMPTGGKRAFYCHLRYWSFMAFPTAAAIGQSSTKSFSLHSVKGGNFSTLVMLSMAEITLGTDDMPPEGLINTFTAFICPYDAAMCNGLLLCCGIGRVTQGRIRRVSQIPPLSREPLLIALATYLNDRHPDLSYFKVHVLTLSVLLHMSASFSE